MTIIDCEQGSPEWIAARCGIPSSSHFNEIITTKGEPSKQRLKYLYRLAGEQITGIPEESYKSNAMSRGTEKEPEARNVYAFINDVEVEEVGFCLADGYGASPDGMVGEDGLLEIKCPMLSTHVEYLLINKLPTNYFQQVQGQLLVTGRDWCDFFSYFPGMNPLTVRVQRDETFLKSLKKQLEIFCQELKETVKKLEG